ncbi:MAG: hypothetical protein LBC27_02605 [Spirochaetaceae bacterium]|jgi:hypothetical protein|nr:hypothetical protein [Spirochaetaceae bacterium]
MKTGLRAMFTEKVRTAGLFNKSNTFSLLCRFYIFARTKINVFKVKANMRDFLKIRVVRKLQFPQAKHGLANFRLKDLGDKQPGWRTSPLFMGMRGFFQTGAKNYQMNMEVKNDHL